MAEEKPLIDDVKLPYTWVKHHHVLVESRQDDCATIVCIAPPSFATLSELKRYLGVDLALKTVNEETFQALMTKQYEMGSGETAMVLEGMEKSIDLSQLVDELPQNEDLLDSEDDAPVIRLLNALFNQAIKEAASDIHIETFEGQVLVRMRIDGILRKVLEIPRALAPVLCSRIKVMARLDIAEKRIPQDGRITLKIANHQVDVRISTMPCNHGERIVMRILDKKSSKLDLSLLGMNETSLNAIAQLIKSPHGIILVTGPTGSGKTTTLYGMLNDLNETERNILTIEDPIEYDLPGIGQTQVNSKIDMTFAKGLRAMLRQDPDVVMVGEIRDLETAEIAVQASLTGHLVISTLHTNTAISAITRLNDMGVESFLLASSLQGLIAQRLVRRLCSHCKSPHQANEEEKSLLNVKDPLTLYKANGCDDCHQLGYQGRLGIYEIVPINSEIRHAIHQHADEKTLIDHARKYSNSILQDGFARVLQGLTTIEEVLRVCHTAD